VSFLLVGLLRVRIRVGLRVRVNGTVGVCARVRPGGAGAQFPRELEADCDPDQHAQSRLLGQERLYRADALLVVIPGHGLPDRLGVSTVEPAALLERRAEDPLQRRSRPCHEVLRLRETLGRGNGFQRGIDLRVAVERVRHLSFRHHTAVAVPLTSLSHGAGCGCKLPAAAIGEVLARLPAPYTDPRVVVGYEGADDAGVFRLRDDLALVHTVDFFTPIVDDPFDFGRIAATNALSDVYAMGAVPITALNLVAFSIQELGEEVLLEILRGGGAVARDAGVAVLGGHSIEDAEPKFGMAVTGTVDPREVLTNAGGRVGDALVLTKPLGAGAVTTALKRGVDDPPLAEAVRVMTTLNREASLAARQAGAHALTDVTGFGLLGHLHELSAASGLAAEVQATAVPAIEGVAELLADPQERAIAGGTRRNRAHAESFATFAAEAPEARRWLVCDAMTSGGLLAAVPQARAHELPGVVIGRLVAGDPGTISVR